MKRIVVLISGTGTNLEAIFQATSSGRLPARVVAVFSNRKDAYGLTRALRRGVPAIHFDMVGGDRDLFCRRLAAAVSAFEPDLIMLLGWMLVLTPSFLDRFPNRVINLHPALPGAFPGTDAIRRTFEAYRRGEVDHAGVMVHYVDEGVDTGPVIVEERVPIFSHDNLDTLTQRIHQVEHRLVVRAAALVLVSQGDGDNLVTRG